MFKNSTDITVLLGILIISLYILLRHVIVSRADGIPPGPTFRLPVVGNLYAVEPDMRKFLRSYRKMYGDIYSLYLGNKLVIVIAGYERIKEAFVKNADVFSNRPKGDIIKKLSKGLGKHSNDEYTMLFVVCYFFFFKIIFFFEKIFQEYHRVSNNLDPDQARRFGPDLGANCLQRL